MTQIDFNKIILQSKYYEKENWGSPLIAAFMLLLLVVAISLSVGWSWLADTVAVYAYYALVAGIFLQLGSYLKYHLKSDSDEVPL